MLERGTRFPTPFEIAFPKGLLQNGSVVPDYEYNPNKNAPKVQKRDEATGLLQWKANVTDPSETNAKRASFALLFTAAVQPVPESPELAAGTDIRFIELEGLTAEPRVMGQGEFKYLGYIFRAEGYRAAVAGGKSASRSDKAA
ncbi:hypothetical protein [Actinocatenispora comari]|uniref:Plasmid replication, integration and excision activator n=1 Tax=Actinocatenispora comari TaxID=2807577 RepID=A0A8J4ADC7_9ACTN|nr:hypothetical protein [Actinocatenispora comari]GIL27062.1 hypothetical protein NUM_23160 [Actinocatenispora comari]